MLWRSRQSSRLAVLALKWIKIDLGVTISGAVATLATFSKGGKQLTPPVKAESS
jgi:hypothetical protein